MTPDVDRLLSTWEDTYDREQWEGFLRTVGYHKTGPAVFAKVLPSPTDEPSPDH